MHVAPFFVENTFWKNTFFVKSNPMRFLKGQLQGIRPGARGTVPAAVNRLWTVEKTLQKAFFDDLLCTEVLSTRRGCDGDTPVAITRL